MATTNTEFRAWLNEFFPDQQPEVVTIKLGEGAPPILSDVVVGQFLHLVAIYVTTVVAYVYTAGLIVGSNAKGLANTVYDLGFELGTFVHQTNDTLTEFVTTFELKVFIDQLTNQSTIGGAYEHQHNLPQL